jgi:hypothetical protein
LACAKAYWVNFVLDNKFIVGLLFDIFPLKLKTATRGYVGPFPYWANTLRLLEFFENQYTSLSSARLILSALRSKVNSAYRKNSTLQRFPIADFSESAVPVTRPL